MIFDDIDDEEECFAITEVFCEKRDIPFNKFAAENAAMNEREVFLILKGKNFNSAEEIQEAMMLLMLEKYKLELSKLIN